MTTSSTTRFCSWCGDQTAGPYCAGCGRPTAAARPRQQWDKAPELRDDGQPRDPVGAGRYIISFLLAGFIGLWIQYWTRYYGWRGVAVNACIATAVIVIYLLMSAAASQDCYDAYGNYVC